MSYGHLGLDGDADGDGAYDVFGPITIDADPMVCSRNTWSQMVDQKLIEQGVDPTIYRHKIYNLPQYTNLGCGNYSGWADIGCGTSCRVWMMYNHRFVFEHELSHNLGMHHSSTDPENDGVINSEYGDNSDVLGGPYSTRLLNAPHLDQMGWLSHLPGKVQVLSQSGVFDIATISENPDQFTYPTIIRLPISNSATSYYLSLRSPQGLDASIQSIYSRGVNIHAFSGSGQTRFITSLVDGAKFTDDKSGLQIEQISKSGDGSSVRVAVSYACSANPIKISLSPSSQSVSQGALANYRLTLSNQDSLGCAGTNFKVDIQNDPLLVLHNFTLADLVLQPGQSQSIDFSLSTQETSGTFSFSANVSDIDGQSPSHSTQSVSGLLSVSAPKGKKGGGSTDGSDGGTRGKKK